MKAVIISGGKPPSRKLLEQEFVEPCFLICADSGADCLFNYNILPDYLIGDFDSIAPEALSYISNTKCIIERHPAEKDETDTQLALTKALKLQAETIVFLGCTGSRLDHTVGNLGLLLQCLNIGITAYIKDENNTILMANEALELTGAPGEYFSVLAYGSDINNLSIKGAKYNLDNYYLELGSSLTVSNQFKDEKVRIDFQRGLLLITKSCD